MIYVYFKLSLKKQFIFTNVSAIINVSSILSDTKFKKEKIMKKRNSFAILTIAGAAVLGLASCEQGKPEPKPDPGHQHSYSELHAKVEPTCLSEGVEAYYSCTGCDLLFNENKEVISQPEAIPALAHTPHHHDAVAPGCETPGSGEYWTCDNEGDDKLYGDKDCKEVIQTIPSVDPKGHKLSHMDGNPSDCKEHGWKEYYKCDDCGALFEDAEGKTSIADLEAWKVGAGKLDLGPHVAEEVKGQASTCKEHGWKDYYHCDVCEKDFEDAEATKVIADLAAWKVGDGQLDYAAHTLEKQNGQGATCTSDGWKDYYKCSVCNKLFEDAQAATEITDLAAWKVGTGKLPMGAHGHTLYAGEESTCKEHGYADAYYCEGCQQYFEDEATTMLIGNAEAYAAWKVGEGQLPFAAHTPVLQEGVEPTCTEKGFKDYYKCSVCERMFEEITCENEIFDLAAWKDGDGKLDPNGHETEKVNGKLETCTENGFKEAYKCKECGLYFEDDSAAKLIGNQEAYESWISSGDGFISMHSHSASKVEGKAKDACRTDGYEEAWKCSECNNYFSDEDCKNLIGNQEAYDAWKANEGKIAKDAHVLGAFVPEVDAHRENDGLKEHYECDVCGCYLDEEGNEITEDTLKIPSRLYEFTANAGKTISLDKTYSMTDTLVLDIKNNGTEGQNVRFMIFDPVTSPEWTDSIGYFKVTQTGIEGNYEGVKTDITDDGFVRITIDLSNVDERLVSGSPVAITSIYLDHRWSDAPGLLEIAPSFEGHEYGELIPEVDACREQSGMKAHYQCSECGRFFDESYSAVSESSLVIEAPAKHFDVATNLTIHFDSPIATTETIYLDFKFVNGVSDSKINISFLGNKEGGSDWDNYLGYYELFSDHVANNDGVSFVTVADDGYTRVKIDMNAVTKVSGTKPEAVNALYVRGGWSNVEGYIEINSSVVPHELGDLIPGTSQSGRTLGTIAHYECEGCGEFFNEDKQQVDDIHIKVPSVHADASNRGKTLATWHLGKDNAEENPFNLPKITGDGEYALFDIEFNTESLSESGHSEMGFKLYDTWDTYFFFWVYNNDNRIEIDGSTSNKGMKDPEGLGIRLAKLEDGWTRVYVNMAALKTADKYRSYNESSPKELFEEINMIEFKNANGNPTYGDIWVMPTLDVAETQKGTQTLHGGDFVRIPTKYYTNEDVFGKYVTFKYKLVGGSLESDYAIVTLMNNIGTWNNISGSGWRLCGDKTSWKGGIVDDLGDGWLQVYLDSARFDGDGANRTIISNFYVNSLSGNVTDFVIDWDSFGFVDRPRDMTTTGRIAKFVNPLANWKNCGAVIEFDYCEIPGSYGGHRNILSLVDKDGKNVAALAFRDNTHVLNQWNGSGEGSALPNSSVTQKEGDVYTARIVLSDINCLNDATGAESIVGFDFITHFSSFSIKAVRFIA